MFAFIYNYNTVLRLGTFLVLIINISRAIAFPMEHQIKALLICLETYRDYLLFLRSNNTDNPLKERTVFLGQL